MGFGNGCICLHPRPKFSGSALRPVLDHSLFLPPAASERRANLGGRHRGQSLRLQTQTWLPEGAHPRTECFRDGQARSTSLSPNGDSRAAPQRLSHKTKPSQTQHCLWHNTHHGPGGRSFKASLPQLGVNLSGWAAPRWPHPHCSALRQAHRVLGEKELRGSAAPLNTCSATSLALSPGLADKASGRAVILWSQLAWVQNLFCWPHVKCREGLILDHFPKVKPILGKESFADSVPKHRPRLLVSESSVNARKLYTAPGSKPVPKRSFSNVQSNVAEARS